MQEARMLSRSTEIPNIRIDRLSTRGSGGIGRHAGFRFLCFRACGFKSHLPHTGFLSPTAE